MKPPILIKALLFILLVQCCAPKSNELNVLAWVGYEEVDLIDPFMEETGIKVNTETFVGANQMFAKITQNPEAYDLVVIDPEYIEKLYRANLLQELDQSQFDFSDYLSRFQDFPLCTINDQFYAVLIRYGVNGLVYNTEKLSVEEVQSYSILWDKKLTGKVGIWDWDLPNMGVLSLSQRLNTTNPYELTREQFKSLDSTLQSLKPQVKAVLGSFSDINAALVRGDIWAVPALGEHTAAVLKAEGYPIEWTIPEEGAIMWIETLGIPPKANNVDNALAYIRYMQRPEVQAQLTWRNAYRSNIPNIEGIRLLSQEQQDILKVHNRAEGEELVNSLYVRLLPTDENGALMEIEWQNSWQEFKAR